MSIQQRILVVDDTPANIAIIGQSISGGYDVIVATNGQDALRLARTEPLPDLILLDILMPEMDGYEVCQRLKSDPLTRKIPVIFITALSEENEEGKGFLLGAVDYITKPISPPIVRARVSTQLALHDQKRELERLVLARTRELENTQDMMIRSLAILAEYRDNETGGHIIRTQFYVRILADDLKRHGKFGPLFADSRYEELLFKSVPLHDVGKVAISDRILLKPGGLTDAEFTDIKKHSTYGGDALRRAEESLAGPASSTFLEIAKKMSYSHHERYDGSGYPQGLRGEDIPVEGRIMAIPDIYDALVSKRTYKPPFSHAKACRIILQGDGRVEPCHFDPDVLAAFARTQEAFKQVAKQFADSEEERQALDEDDSPLDTPSGHPTIRIGYDE